MEKITTGTCSIDETEIKYVTDALQNKMLSNGKYLHKFEKIMAEWYGKKHAIMVNSGQTALELALTASRYRLGPGELYVGLPILTYMATTWSTLMEDGIRPVFFDINKENYGININNSGYDEYNFKIDADELDILMPVDLFGKKCRFSYNQLNSKIIVIEDACEAVMNPSCRYGDFIALSFYSSHILSCGSGGMLLLNEDDEANYIRSYIAHGRNHDGDFTKRGDKFMDRFIFSNFGRSLRSDNITAAIGVAQFEKGNGIINTRVRVAYEISKGLSSLKESGILSLPCPKENVFMFYPIVFNVNGFKILDFMEYLWDKNIDSRRLMPVLEQPAFKKHFPGIDPERFPNALECEKNGVILGCHQDMTNEQISYLVETIKDYFRS